jgi:hypothetical protein
VHQYSDHELDSQIVLHALIYLVSQYVFFANCGLVDPSHIDLISGITTFNVDDDADFDTDIVDDGFDDKDNDCVDDEYITLMIHSSTLMMRDSRCIFCSMDYMYCVGTNTIVKDILAVICCNVLESSMDIIEYILDI